MGVKQAFARLFGRGTQTGQASASNAGTTPLHDPGMATNRTVQPAEPVGIDVFDDSELIESGGAAEQQQTGEMANGRAPIVAPRNRQELIKELQKNYTEVVGLVRKVDDHLDTQTHRSERLLELAERSARNMDALPELVEQNKRVADALNDLIELTRDARTRSDAAADRLNKTAIQQLESGQRQTAALQTMQATLHRSGEAEQEMARSIGGFNETLSEMSSSTRDLGDTIGQLRETDAEREAELAKLVSSGQKWLVAAVVLCGLMAVVAVALVINRVV
jgi:methyl-accepting chemotaxis protein